MPVNIFSRGFRRSSLSEQRKIARNFVHIAEQLPFKSTEEAQKMCNDENKDTWFYDFDFVMEERSSYGYGPISMRDNK